MKDRRDLKLVEHEIVKRWNLVFVFTRHNSTSGGLPYDRIIIKLLHIDFALNYCLFATALVSSFLFVSPAIYTEINR